MQDLIQLSEETKKLTILIVEDRADDNEQMKALFSNLFKEVYTARDGEEGLAVYKEKKPDVIATDLIMPNMDGLDMIEAIKNINQHQLIVVVSASDDIEKISKTVALNVTSFIYKPIETQKLIDALSSVVSKIKKQKTIETKAFTVTIPLDMYEEIDQAAKAESISKNAIIIRLVKKYLEDEIG